MPRWTDGPVSPHFTALRWLPAEPLPAVHPRVHVRAAKALLGAPSGDSICCGMPFSLPAVPFVVTGEPLFLVGEPVLAQWLVFQHSSDWPDPDTHAYPGRFLPRGAGGLGEPLADYVIGYEDGTDARIAVRRRHELGVWETNFGDPPVSAVSARKPMALGSLANDRVPFEHWGMHSTAVVNERLVDGAFEWVNWLWAWENPRADVPVVSLRIEPRGGMLFFFGICASRVVAHPLRWGQRQRMRVPLPATVDVASCYRRSLSENDELLAPPLVIDIDLGGVVRVFRPSVYPDADWQDSPVELPPSTDGEHAIVEFVAHAEALFHLGNTVCPVASLSSPTLSDAGASAAVVLLPPATLRLKLRIVERGRGLPLAARLHMHSGDGQYFAPEGWRRAPNGFWFQDTAADLDERGHCSAYVPGEAWVRVPIGRLYLEVSKGFEFAARRSVFDVTAETTEIVVELERVLDWRGRGWSTADTHVHFVSPTTGLLEGAAEDVHLVHLLAAQWGEMMSNSGDFDGGSLHRYHGSSADDHYHLVVGTENRQRVLGHISLLSYGGPMITPMSSGGPSESTMGDPVGVTLTQWAEQCRAQGGVVVMPHFPNPRLENAAVLVGGHADAVELGGPFHGEAMIDPYAVADWYRYLNCGVHTPVVGGTDKMSAAAMIGAIRTYARLEPGEPLTVERWNDAVRRGRTFVSVGALIEFRVEGLDMGARLAIAPGGATLAVQWEAASLRKRIVRVDLVRDGVVIESQQLSDHHASGAWSVHVERSGWLALLVRTESAVAGREIVAAHSSAVMVDVQGSSHGAAADALTILEQIEGAIAYLDTVATRGDDAGHRAMRLKLTAIHRDFHRRMHDAGAFHHHLGPHHHGHG